MKRITLLFSFLVLLFTVANTHAFDARREVLPEGLVLLHSGQHHLPVVHIVVLIKASPFDEPSEKAGLANLVAELLVEGTQSRTSEQISEEIDFIGAELDVSATRDYTTLSLAVLKKHLEKGLDILADVLLHPSFSEEEIKRKKELIKGSLKRAEEDPSFVASKEFRKALYGESHPYGRLVRGSAESLDRITRKDIQDFYNSYYRPDNAIISVVGDIDYQETVKLLSHYLKEWKAGTKSRKMSCSVPQRFERRIITIDRDLKQATIVLGHLAVKRSDPDYYPLQVMNYILGGGGFASRLMTRIREDMGLAYDVYSFITSSKDVGLFQVGVQTKNPSARDVIDVIVEEMKRIQNEPVTDEELSDAKAYLTGSFPRRIDTMGKIANFLVLTEFYGLGLNYDKDYIRLINSVTKKDIQQVARKYLHPEG
ncbi:MAG: insulinase family protein, partial [Nitrospirae bacterium]